MIKKYKQLTLAQRYKIEAYLSPGISQTAIAAILGVYKNNISRELSRSIPKRGQAAKTYVAINAHSKAYKCHLEKRKHTRFTETLKQQMKQMLSEKNYNTELVAAHWKRENTQGVSHENP